jgi:hypothetical protein
LLTHHGKTPLKWNLPFLYILHIIVARIIWATAREDVTPYVLAVSPIQTDMVSLDPKIKDPEGKLLIGRTTRVFYRHLGRYII